MDRFSLKSRCSIVSLVDVWFSGNGKSYVAALDDVDLKVEAGEIVALVGHNGSGKTTLLRAISGILPPTSGTVKSFGSVSCLIDPGAGIDFEGTGAENIFLLAYTAGHRKSVIESKFDEIVEFASLGDFIYLPVRTYSAGMIARLAFSVATSFDADIVVMDEGIAAGDAGFLERASGRIKEMYSQAGCVVLATHSHEFARQRCNRVITMEHGRIVSDVSNKEF